MPEEPQETAKPVESKQTPTEATQPVVHNNPGVLVLQWLTYAFWGWTILALAWLTAISIGFFLNPESTENYESTIVSYSLAAVIVLFLVSAVCDAFYARVEPLRKTGGAMVIMIIHAVIFALFGIGALITAVFGMVRLLIGDGDGANYGDSGAWTTIITGLFITLVYGATLLRTVRPFKLKRSGMIYGIFMGVATLAIVIMAIAGPAYSARMTRDDRLIERALPQLSESIRAHTEETNVLPKTLAEVRDDSPEDAKTLIDRNLVEYKPGEKIEVNAQDMLLRTERSSTSPDEAIYSYTLCVTYKAKKGTSSYPAYAPEGRQVSPDTYRHDAGRVCYDLQTSYSYNGKLY